jgi:hypothetical protein
MKSSNDRIKNNVHRIMNTPFSPVTGESALSAAAADIVFFFLFDHSKTMMIYFTKFIHKCQTKGYNSGTFVMSFVIFVFIYPISPNF